MEYVQQSNLQIKDMGQQSQEIHPNSNDYTSRRSGSVVLRAGKLYPTCDCIKRNGLQHECRRTECQSKSSCITRAESTPSPANFVKKSANYSLGSSYGLRNRSIARADKIQTVPGSEVPLASAPLRSDEFTEIKDLDPKILGQIFPNGIPSSIPFSQFNASPMMTQPIQAFPQNYSGIPVSQTTMMSAPQSTSTSKSQWQDELRNSTQTMMNAPSVFSGVPRSFSTTPTPISSIEPMPTLHPLSANNTFVSGVPVLQKGQHFAVPAQSFAPYTGDMSSYNPYSSNMASYLPCGTGGISTMSSGIPCGTAQ